MIVTGKLKNARISPRKVKPVADLLRGMKASEAVLQLNYLDKKASKVLLPLVKSSIANAIHNNKLNPETIVINDVKVGPGVTFKRGMIRAKGGFGRILKRTTNIKVELFANTDKTKDKSILKKRKEVFNE